ncbi:carbon-nitrogen hydrolase family protein [Kineobactrum sediminis]|uniref:Carbon-nitrogen hydrolase family protein n=1 Tax=Kineobactrum sediminis TaxID=1905677 RepID=A0A2N5Y659_9GAMM|nr:carbon-nitrogen hydrolase family protein [Kineobactrum sediminis]PLW83878.1 carbon-nitrogen hydrolase family protein [Kineobactrum sediminis]
MPRFAIAGLQLELDNRDNLFVIDAEVKKVVARFPWVNMVVIGELATFGPGVQHAQPLPSDIEAHYCRLAAEHGIWLVPGTLFERDGEEVFNTLPVINPAGEVVARYRKMFPFFPYEQGVACGTDFVVFDVPEVGRMGVSICYDGWFPETTRTLAWMGAEVIIHPTMTNTIDRDLELAIARTNAAINQCYFVDINVAGRLGNGRSIVCGPEGNVIHQAGTGYEVITFEADFELVRRTRERGLMGLGQVLKSFRDSPVKFPPYIEGHSSPALQQLGKLQVPGNEWRQPEE